MARPRRVPRPAPLPATFRLLAAAQAVGGLLALGFAAWPLSSGSPTGIAVGVGLASLALAALTATIAPRFGSPGLATSYAAASVVLASITGLCVTPQGQVICGVALVGGATTAAQILDRRRALVLVVVALVIWTVAVAVSRLGLTWVAVLVVWATTLGLVWTTGRMVDRLQAIALTDPLTGAFNRAGLEQRAAGTAAVAERAGRPTTVVAIDLDGFKAFNDQHGHPAGDRLLADLTSSLRAELRQGDTLARIGGDEFALVLPGAGLDAAAATITRMRTASPARWSAGTAVWQPGEALFDALARADRALYADKARPVDLREQKTDALPPRTPDA